ncbi:hypothetical protein PHMEG_00018671 [Phytophthora megakarya]|uniref:Uncharacterized protein n=1 Tax=Phytophthora megakarya TaxID=4795 RepID=A0A225VTU4_9STRA|nr:hypothetical protein PHMEG_00018671 [Phytophthora megakarya]
MHRISRIMKLSDMGKERQEIVGEIGQIFEMLNVVSWFATTDGPASENEEAPKFLVKLKNLKLSHDEIQAVREHCGNIFGLPQEVQ